MYLCTAKKTSCSIMDDKPVLIFGAGGLGKAALEIFNSHGVIVYGLLDDDEETHGQEIGEVSILGATNDDGFLKLIGKKCDAFVAVDENSVRESLVEMLKERRKVMPTNALHRDVSVAQTATLRYGTFVNAGVRIGAEASIGNHCILHSNAVIEHGVSLEEFVQVGAGSVLNAGVTVGEGAFIGSGVTIVGGVKIGKGARIGAGSVVIADVEEEATVFGNPAQMVGS